VDGKRINSEFEFQVRFRILGKHCVFCDKKNVRFGRREGHGHREGFHPYFIFSANTEIDEWQLPHI
jgi:hypothetical protein